MTDPPAAGPAIPPRRIRLLRLLEPLRVRFALLVTLIVAVVVGASSYLQVRVFESAISADLEDTAIKIAVAVADDVEVRSEPLNHGALAESLREFYEAVPSLRAISVVRLENGEPIVLVSTAAQERPEVLGLAQAAIRRSDTVYSSFRALKLVAVPARREERLFGAVVVTYSKDSVEQLKREAGIVLVWFVPSAILLLALLMDLLTRTLIHQPIAGIRRTMERVAAGELGARAPVLRSDEIGAVGSGLNTMLAQMEGFNVALQERVREATSELRARNVELVQSYERVLGLREALGRAEQLAAVGHMAASVAHQIGTPLNLISGYVQVIREEYGPDARVTRRLEIVQEQIAKVTSIVRTMMDHARLPSPRERTDMAALVQRVCDLARPKLNAMDVRLDLAVSDVPAVMAEPVQLELALVNLLTNSLDAMPEGGVVTITVTAAPEGVRLDVADTGTGIPAELLPRIFEPWVTTKEAGRGSGLGLSITRDVVAAHGGTITAKTELGVGSTFTLTLPAADSGVAAV
ncbi:MAG TPA: ATP-binding protein [Vicinamibacterales bacterium]|nr:ATP-binding protein [Vicinamibacterales bacterium]